MAGSDLDGDQYFVCWKPDLIFPRDNAEPMMYLAAEKKDLGRAVQPKDIAEHIKEYIKKYNIGQVSHAHLIQADLQENGVFSDECLQIAKLASKLVDAPKTGQWPEMDRDLRPDKVGDFSVLHGS